MPGKKFTDDLIRDALEFMRQGNDLKTTGAHFGCNPDNLSKAIRARGLQIPVIPRKAPNRYNITIDQIQPFIDRDFSVKAIAEKFGIARNVVTRIMNEAGIKPLNR